MKFTSRISYKLKRGKDCSLLKSLWCSIFDNRDSLTHRLISWGRLMMKRAYVRYPVYMHILTNIKVGKDVKIGKNVYL